MVIYRVLRRKDVPEVQAVALKAWMFAYRRYGLSLKLIKKFVSERYSTDSFEKTVLPSVQKGESQFYLATDKEDNRLLEHGSRSLGMGTLPNLPTTRIHRQRSREETPPAVRRLSTREEG